MSSIRIQGVDVRIPIYDSHALRLIRLPSLRTARVGTNAVTHHGSSIVIHALTGLDLELSSGDRVCLIGHNGAGKTTLLRLVAGIYPPDRGTVEVQGKVFALLGSSMALNPDATGYENIRLIANLYDWPTNDLAAAIHDIEEFTELGEYLSLPVRTYSAGMQTRLGFAIATARSPEILLIDEGIGAGDLHFQEKAFQRVHSFVNRANIVLLASHSIPLCKAICNKGLVLSKGHIIFLGEIEEAIQAYTLQS
jgi:ABC-2 type transport system ATP-binding protein/lipopolysaccharide transport system ATP-binding protein